MGCKFFMQPRVHQYVKGFWQEMSVYMQLGWSFLNWGLARTFRCL